MKFTNYIIVLFLSITFKLSAGYYGGDIIYQWQNGYTYKITLRTYTNFLNDTKCQVQINVGGSTITVNRSNGLASTTCSPALSGVQVSTDVLYNEYQFNYSFPGPGNNLISFEGTNRNPGVINIPNSVNQLMYLETTLIISTFLGANNSPIFTYPSMVENACLNSCFLFNAGAYDSDGDSLSYEATACCGSGGSSCPGYSYPSSGINGTYNVDSITGTITWCSPQLQGAYNVAMIVREWRKNNDGDYVIIASYLREFTINASVCAGVSENEINHALMYPNPTSDILTIKLGSLNENSKIELLNSIGQSVYMQNQSSQSVEVNMKEFASGIYYLKITDNKGTNITKKIIKN